jgi:subtilisin family serine protease
VAVKFYDADSLASLKNELEGAYYLDANGLDYARIYAWGTLPDGRYYVVKELVDGMRLMFDGALGVGDQRAIVNGLADNARKGIVELDGRPDNWFTRETVLPDGSRVETLARLDTGYVSPVAKPSPAVAYDWFQWGDEFADGGAFYNRWLHPDIPVLGGNAVPIQSLMGLDRAVIAQMQKHPLINWFNNLMEMERRGLIQFDPVARALGDGQIPISMLREHPEWRGVVAEFERIVRGGAPLVGTPVAEIGAIRRTFDGTVGGVTRAITEILAPLSQADAAFRAARAAGRLAPPVGGTAGRVTNVVVRLSGGANVDPFTFMANEAPRCWSGIEQITEVPPGAGGGYLIRITTQFPDEFARALATNANVGYVEPDKVEKAQVGPPNDPFYSSRGSWQQPYDDQWGLKRIGFAPDSPLWDLVSAPGRQVIVAVIDSGLDYLHPDLGPIGLWRNPMEVVNSRDDDGNGYVDDVIGWNFVQNDGNPWDDLGHGTHVAGIIAARTGNEAGIAGINPRARIMPLKVLDRAGQGLASNVAAAVFYAVRHGAHVINLSLGERGLSETEEMAIGYARSHGLVVVVAGGNAGSDTGAYGPAGLPGAIAVAALGPDDRRPAFSNWGDAVQIAAPGVDVLSLRADGTDLNLAMGVENYRPGSSIVGADARYYRASGTSFAAPFVAGVASLLLSRNPDLSATQVERMLLMAADDVDTPGWDRHSGAGRLNAAAALRADPDWFLRVRVTAVQPVREGSTTLIQVRGSVTGTGLTAYRIELGQGETPSGWKTIGGDRPAQSESEILGTIPATEITAAGQWTVRVVARDARGNAREARAALTIR